MQWIQLLLWASLTFWAAKEDRRAALWPWVLSLGILLSMGTQLALLADVGQLHIGTALPLHLCAMMGVLTIPMLLWSIRPVYSFSIFLGAPCALLALCFPAIAQSRHPWLMASAFFRLHVLILCAPLFLRLRGFPWPWEPRGVFLAANGYLLLVAAFNRAFHTNYMFLALPPAGTPLQWLGQRGGVIYLCSLELLAMVSLTLLAALYRFLQEKAAAPAFWRKLRLKG
ncbi:MAG: YwaF family protein [Candidatus Limiplasma sp.]|nr:YwaF family protein [Candidatus Limiplasma sp.]